MESEPKAKRAKTEPSPPSITTSKYFTKHRRLSETFFNVECMKLAKSLLGTVLVKKLKNGSLLRGKIVETECYPGNDDKASYSYNGRRTPRNEPMYMKPGTMFVYKTYGMYHCLNISSEGEGAAVLLRALEPIEGIDKMSENRLTYHPKRKGSVDSGSKSKNAKNNLKPHQLCNGPSKLCISFDITSENSNKIDITNNDDVWIEERLCPVTEEDIITSTRIGIDSAGKEWASKLFRFYLKGNTSVSVKDKVRDK